MAPDPSERPPAEIAVVIATRERETRLVFALEALAEQTLGRDRFEVVVVRGGAIAEPLAGAPPGMRARFLAHDGPPGAAAQRNRGWRATAAPFVAFIDDDSRPAPGWLEAVLAAEAGERTVLQGRIEPDPGELHLLYGLARSHEITGPSPRYEAGNIVYPRALLERLGGFDESFAGHAWGEDTDLGLRAAAAGASLAYVDEALVWHAVLPRTLSQALAEAERYAWLVRLLARYPDFRRAQFPHGVIDGSHPLFLLALAGTLAIRRRPLLAAAAVTPYLARQLGRHLEVNDPSPRKLARFAVHLPAVVLLDLAEVAVTVVAAIRHRVPII